MNFPHDKLIKSVFANEKNAIEFLSKQLPQELVQSFNNIDIQQNSRKNLKKTWLIRWLNQIDS